MLLSDMLERNSEILVKFLQQLDHPNYIKFRDGIFSLVHELLVNNKELELEKKARLFNYALEFYNGERINIDEELIKTTMHQLSCSPNTAQVLGLANLVFFSES